MKNDNRLKPSPKCLFCDKTISEVGGKRIIAKKTKAVFVSDKNVGGGDNDYPTKCIRLTPENNRFLVLRMPRSEFAEEFIERAKSDFFSGFHPWFCQKCGNNICQECGSPTQLVMGADTIDAQGNTGHQAIFPINPGCKNKDCKNHLLNK